MRKNAAPGRMHPSTILIVVLALMPFSSPAQKETGSPDPQQIESQIRAIRSEAKHIDASIDSPEQAGLTRVEKQLPNWELSGLFEKSAPVYLTARLSEGEVVREETYYFRQGQPILVKVEKWWDVEDEAKAPEPPTRHEFYIQNDRLLRVSIRVNSKPPVTRLGDASGSPKLLIQRSATVAQILEGKAAGQAIESLRDFPGLDQP